MTRQDYLRRAKELHPDNGGDPEAFKKLNAEYRLLTGKDKPQGISVNAVLTEALLKVMTSVGERCLYIDVIDVMRNEILGKQQSARASKEQAKKDHAQLTEMLSRFSNAPFAVLFLEPQIANALAGIRRQEALIDSLDEAIKALADARYNPRQQEIQVMVINGVSHGTVSHSGGWL